MKTKNNKTKKGGKKKELTAFEKAFSAARKKGKAEFTWKGKKYNTRTFEDETWDTIEHGPAINKKQEKTRNKRIAKQIAKRSKYQQGGGMYAENVMPAGLGSTAMTVYQESNPALQQQRMQALEAQKSKAIEETEAMAKEIEESKAGDAAKIREAKDMGTAQVEAGLGIGTQGLQIADEAGLLGKGTMTAAEQSAKDKQSLVGALKSAKNIYSATRAAKKTMKTVEGFNKAKMAFDMKRRLDMGEKAWKFQQSVKNTKQALESAKGTLEGIKGGKMTMQGFKTASELKDASSGMMGALKVPELSMTMDKTTGLLKASDKVQQLSKGSAVGKGLKDFATSGAGIGLMASGAGYAAKKIWGDDDDTKYNAGEVAGDILSGVGTGMSTAAMLGSVVPGVGNVAGAVVGGLYGLGKGLLGQNKAKKAQRKMERERKLKIRKFDEEVVGDLRSQMARARAGSMKQKRYSGYDLGRNVTMRRGGYRGMPRYAYAV